MKKFALPEDKNPSDISAYSALEAVLRDGARKMLQEAIENEVLEYIQRASLLRSKEEKQLVIRRYCQKLCFGSEHTLGFFL